MSTLFIILSLFVAGLPLGTFLVLYFFGNKLPRKGDWLATGIMGVCFFISVFLFFNLWGKAEVFFDFTWFEISGISRIIPFKVSIALNSLSAMMMVVVTLISFLVHMYSIEYMYDKKNYFRYFPYLGLFTSSMIGIVLSNNLLVTFMCWELVGFASYLLIGFWMEKEGAAKASKKAFLVNRIGDVGFIIGLCVVYSIYGTFELDQIKSLIAVSGLNADWLITLAGLGIFMGCVGKSAQFPLQLWLPDAMEGPTPASALIHAATMVAAGIYLLAKTYFLLNPITLMVIACIGALTALMGALPAVAQTDIKKVLAYSTISQLGFMVMAMGVGAYDAALFHLITHAFFKSCLFLTAGAVIHEMHHVKRALFIRGYFFNFDTLNMKLMGGLRSRMPITFITYMFSSLALIGVPLFSGFLSKDAILEGAFHWASLQTKAFDTPVFYIIPIVALVSVALTAYYMIRQMVLVFFGDLKLKVFYPQVEESVAKIHDPGWFMKIPMLVLGSLSLWFFYSLNPIHGNTGWLLSGLNTTTLFISNPNYAVMLGSITAILLGGGVAWYRFNPSTYIVGEDGLDEGVKRLLKNNWYMDALYNFAIVKPGIFISKCTAHVDHVYIDGVLHFTAYFTVISANLIGLFDKFIIDGFVNLNAWASIKIGNFAKSFQQGGIQGYFAYVVAAIIMVFLWLFITTLSV